MATTRLRLGEMLLQRGVCTREQLLEAWQQRVLFGDRLGTNLLSLGHVDEATLAKALGAQHGVHAGYGKVLRVDPEATRLIPRALAEKRSVVPHHVAERALFLLMKDPHDAVAIDDVQFASGLKVVPVVVVEARLWQLVETHYRARMTLRPIPLDRPGRVVRKDANAEITSPGPRGLGPELTSEEDFQRLYAGMHAQPAPVFGPSLDELDDITSTFGTAPAPVAPAPVATAAPAAPAASDSFLAPPRTGADPEVRQWREVLEHTNPMMQRPELSARADPDAPPVSEPFALVDLAEGEGSVPFPERQQTLDFHIDVGELLDETPLSFADASRVLQAAADRNAIARVVLRATRSQFKRACLLTVFPDRFVGWLGIGEGFEQERMRDVVVPRSDRSVFGLVAESRSHYIGPLQKWPLHGAWVKATGRKLPSSVAVFPILVRGRPVNLLVVDNGHSEHVGTDLGEVLILAQQIAGTYESLLGAA